MRRQRPLDFNLWLRNSLAAKTVNEFVNYAKANRGKITFASTEIGASPHLSGELIKRQAGIEMTNVPYCGAGPAINGLGPGIFDSVAMVDATCDMRHFRGLVGFRMSYAASTPGLGYWPLRSPMCRH